MLTLDPLSDNPPPKKMKFPVPSWANVKASMSHGQVEEKGEEDRGRSLIKRPNQIDLPGDAAT
jgi:hypothetical protein